MRFLTLLLLLSLPLKAWSEKQYFQQKVSYRISVQLDDVSHALSAREQLIYYNNSPDTLHFIWFHLWPNAYSDRTTALSKQKLENGQWLLYMAKEEQRGFIDSLAFSSNQKPLRWEYHPQHRDICKLYFNRPLLPGDSIEISTPFYVKLPSAKYSRLGHTGQFYAITQWFPKPAVYDRYGWHEMPYLDQGEFYSEFGTFEVSITLPQNYVVGATGELVNGEQEERWLTEKAQEEVPLDGPADMSFPPSSPALKTLTFRQDNVHDFAFFADKRYHVRKGEVTLPRSGKKITTWAFFTSNESKLWMNAIEYIHRGLLDYSNWIGDYPYASCTAIDGTIAAGGGMEYPMITIIGESDDPETLETTIVHEVGHNWFYGVLASNEREHPWMDEGINTYYENRSFVASHPPTPDKNYNDFSMLNTGFLGTGKIPTSQGPKLAYLLSASSHSDQPANLRADRFTYINTGTIIYRKVNAAFSYLQQYLGTALFDSCMQQYFAEWKFRHPYPQDLQQVFETVSGKQLGWFFQDLLGTVKQQDAVLKKVSLKGETAAIKIKSLDNALWPLPVTTYKDKTPLETRWIQPGQKISSFEIPCNGCDEIKIDPDNITLDVNNLNNNSRINGIFRKCDPVDLKFIAGITHQPVRQIYWLPLAGWNNYNKLMAGVLLHNRFLPFRKFEYSFLPMYGFHDQQLAGLAQFDYHIYPDAGLVREIILTANARRFGFDERSYRTVTGINDPEVLHYLRFNPSLRMNFRPSDPRSTLRQNITFSSVHLLAEDVKYRFSEPGAFTGEIEEEQTDFYRIHYVVSDSRILDPWSVSIRYEGAENLTKTDLTLRYKFSYNNVRRGVYLRMFAGIVWNNENNSFYNYSLSDRASAGGSNDYAFDNFYFGRSETDGLLSRQMAFRDGAFKSKNPLGSFREKIICLNLEADFPGRLPLRFFADIATYNDLKEDVKQIFDLNQSVTYNAGICIVAANEAVAIYLPLLRSQEILDYEKTNGLKLREQIRFVFDIAKLNPFNLRQQINP